jgi:drug/metabolite transporter (DMT)-like permease
VALFGFIGVVLICYKQLEFKNLIGIGFGLLSGVTLAIIITMQKKNAVKYDAPVLVTQYSFIQASLALFMGKTTNSIHIVFDKSLLYLVLLGILVKHASLIYNYALKHIKVSTASILAYLEVAFASLIGYFIFNQKIIFAEFIGILLIVIAGISIVYLDHVRVEEVE